jgi:hypothetical protein
VPPIVIHDALVVAVHGHPASVVIVTVPGPPDAGNDGVAGLTV